ncbi:Chloride intracellular channel protein 6 [Collichthys lucidus]|uniref:Chloride intracellular channel protein 6 n=1 Tax=Collichthys lucidus TaxID=240159 RepID=A0A4U5TWR5_COLLU|nr:Chloride intracellular channel protein 6 [Collichthys lucidus]
MLTCPVQPSDSLLKHLKNKNKQNTWFILETMTDRKPAALQDLAPGTNPPFVTFNGEVKVDVNKIEEFLEEKLTPPRYPRLAPKHPEANTAGIDVFAKFSAYIKNARKDTNDGKGEHKCAANRSREVG